MPSIRLDWKAAMWAGIAAGIVFIMLEMALIAMLQGQSPWGPPRMMAAIALGEGVLPPPATFDPAIMLAAMFVHLMLSVIYAVVLGAIFSRLTLNLPASIAAGTVFGVALYVINFYGFTALFPWFAMARGGIGIFGHAVFGLVLGWVYHTIASRNARLAGSLPA